jgi:hypothetical protein
VSNGTFTANLVSDRAVFDGKLHLAPQAGRYTLIIPSASDNSASTPDGNSFGTVTVDKAGRIRLAASLADATKLSQAVTLSKNGDWPLYVPLYGGNGSMMSWLAFNNTASSDIDGDVVWIKPNVPSAKLYPLGFKVTSPARGSRFQGAPAPGNLLTFTNGELALVGGDLAGSITNQITLGARNRVTNLSANKLTLTFSPSKGSFTGRVINPASGKPVSFSGVVLQKENAGFGWFLGLSHSGLVSLAEP